jgi:hypothetical protein
LCAFIISPTRTYMLYPHHPTCLNYLMKSINNKAPRHVVFSILLLLNCSRKTMYQGSHFRSLT